MTKSKTLPLEADPIEDRIKQIRAECDAIVAKHAAEVKKTCEGVPLQVIRQEIELRARGCPCAQAMYVIYGKEAAKHLERDR